MIHLPVRFTSERGDSHAHTTLNLEIATTALLLVDCDGDCGPACNAVIEQSIAPTLAANLTSYQLAARTMVVVRI
jgi:hypothetical protein